MDIYSILIPSPLGDLVAIASDEHLLMLEFADSEELEEKASVIARNFSAPVKNDAAIQVSGRDSELQKPQNDGALDCFVPRNDGISRILQQTESQLREYFEGQRKQFDIPLKVDGTDFQKDAWKGLQKIPYGETRSYGEQAKIISRPKAVRAIGGANHNNRIVIIIPCHRVIGTSGKLVGYGGGIKRKIWLLEHEKKHR